MTGVEILAMEEVATTVAFNWTVFWIVVGVTFAIFLFMGISLCVSCGDFDDIIIGVIAGAVLGCFFGAICGSSISITTSYETQYKVIISDEVSMNEFLERYEIIDQEGKIYTVRERNEESE
jgi:hypothetical protein